MRDARRAMGEKKNNFCFLLFSLLNFAGGAVRKIEFLPIQKESRNHLACYIRRKLSSEGR